MPKNYLSFGHFLSVLPSYANKSWLVSYEPFMHKRSITVAAWKICNCGEWLDSATPDHGGWQAAEFGSVQVFDRDLHKIQYDGSLQGMRSTSYRFSAKSLTIVVF